MSVPSPSANPYQPPPEVGPETAPAIGTPIQYDSTPTREDLQRALRSGPAMVWDVVMMTLLLLFVGMILLSQIAVIRRGGAGPPTYAGDWMFAIFLICIPGSLAAFGFYRKLFAAKIYLQHYPRALQRRWGTLTDEGFLLWSDEGKTWWPHKSLVLFQHQKDQVTICYDVRGASKQILPERGFSDPVTAAKVLEFYAKQNQRPALGGLDERMLEPFSGAVMIGDQPAEAICFSGTLCSGDLVGTPLHAMRKAGLGKALTFLLLLHLGVVFLYWWLGIMVAVIAAVPLVFIDYLSWLIFRRSLRPLSDPQQPLMRVRGWLDKNHLTMLSAIEQSVTPWSRFNQVGSNEQILWLHFDSGGQLYLLLHRRFFDNEKDWQAAQEIMREGVTSLES